MPATQTSLKLPDSYPEMQQQLIDFSAGTAQIDALPLGGLRIGLEMCIEGGPLLDIRVTRVGNRQWRVERTGPLSPDMHAADPDTMASSFPGVAFSGDGKRLVSRPADSIDDLVDLISTTAAFLACADIRRSLSQSQ